VIVQICRSTWQTARAHIPATQKANVVNA